MPADILNEYLAALFSQDAARAIVSLERAAGTEPDLAAAMLRLALHRPSPSLLHWRKLHNVWSRLERPMLKPSPVTKDVLLLTDSTADGLVADLPLAASAYGVRARVTAAPFDSVEQTALSADLSAHEVVVLLLSEDWLRRQFGSTSLIERSRVDAARDRIFDLIAALRERSPADILVANLPGSAYHSPVGTARVGSLVGWTVAVSLLNAALAELTTPRAYLLDVADAVFGAGGRATLGRISFLRARMAYEPAAAIAVAQAIASAVANLSGKTHRALVTDWDNTLWGGEIAEVGAAGVVCGQESPDALAYFRLQEQIKALRASGVLLVAVSRNDPAIAVTLADNRDLALSLEDFASLQVSWQPKSDGVERAAQALGFGAEFMVYLDDSLFEIAEVMRAHRSIDVILAGPQPQATLERLGDSRYFAAVHLIGDDLQRAERAASLQRQSQARSAFANVDEFLRDIHIVLRVSPIAPDNVDRIVQLLQKTNQFNLTTRRHTKGDLEQLVANGALIWAFAYEDVFGSQGVISAVVVVPDGDAVHIDSWVMSCRVLNRSVELGVFAHIVAATGGRPLRGTFVATDRNGLVRDLYPNLGFRRAVGPEGAEVWLYDPAVDSPPRPHHTSIVTDTNETACHTTSKN